MTTSIHVQYHILGGMLLAAGLADPLSIPWILAGSIVSGAVGGITAAWREGKRSPPDVLTYALSMAVFGASMSMVGFWWFEDSSKLGYALIGVSGLCALVGPQLFEPLAKMVNSIISVFSRSIEGAIGRMLGGSKDNDTD